MTHTCPICKKEYSGYSALSRVAGVGDICPLCGIREALDAAGVKDTVLINEIVAISEEARNEYRKDMIAVET